jgi:hypothetical protein
MLGWGAASGSGPPRRAATVGGNRSCRRYMLRRALWRRRSLAGWPRAAAGGLDCLDRTKASLARRGPAHVGAEFETGKPLRADGPRPDRVRSGERRRMEEPRRPAEAGGVLALGLRRWRRRAARGCLPQPTF